MAWPFFIGGISMAKKIICQNCFKILAERNFEERWFKIDDVNVESILQEIDPDHSLLTISCPECGCMLQVKV